MYKAHVFSKREMPAKIAFDGMGADAFINYYLDNKQKIEHKLFSEGAVKFTGVPIHTMEDFQYIINAISEKFLNYVDGNSPRTKLSNNVYTSTEYDKTQRITMHNELSYSVKWPGKIFFSCLQVAETGGETLLADSRAIMKMMNKDIVEAIMNKGIIYIRNLHGGAGMGPSWQETFETTDKSELETICRTYGISYEWLDNDSLRLKQPSKGIIRHRFSHEWLWFNQVDQFHPCHLGDEVFEVLKIVYQSPSEFPMYVTFGDGTDIPESFVMEILDTIKIVTTAPVWNTNELLILDNELMTHGRASYTGERKVLVAMSE